MPAVSGCLVFAAGLGYQAASCVVAVVSLGDACHVELVVQGYVAAAAAAAVALLAFCCSCCGCYL